MGRSLKSRRSDGGDDDAPQANMGQCSGPFRQPLCLCNSQGFCELELRVQLGRHWNLVLKIAILSFQLSVTTWRAKWVCAVLPAFRLALCTRSPTPLQKLQIHRQLVQRETFANI